MKPNKINAINSLCAEHHPNVGTIIRGKDKDISDISCLTLEDGNTPSFKWEDVEAKHTSMVSDWEAQAYARARQPLYPDIGDQLDDLYHKGAFSAEMKAKIKKVKDDNPKP